MKNLVDVRDFSIPPFCQKQIDSVNGEESLVAGIGELPYDAAARGTSMTVAGQTTVNYSYDNANRLTQITQGSSSVTYTYDAAGRRTSLTLPNGVLVEYAYDAASRLTSITYKQNGTTVLGNLTYEYDKNGNRTKAGGSFARTGVPQAIASTAYNAANHQTTFGDKTLTYDNNGNLQTITDTGGTTTYTWNARDQLIGISGPGVSASFVYDGFGRREKKTINGSLTEFLFDGVNPVQETSGAPVLANILPGLGIDEFLSRTDVNSGLTSAVLTDALGSVLALTDSTGAVQTEYTYEPFGKTTVTGSANSSSYQYTGRESDGTGLVYYRSRYYHPELQRFISEDQWKSARTRGKNLYPYVNNNPLRYSDPLGLHGLSGPDPDDPPDEPPTCGRKCPEPEPDPPSPDGGPDLEPAAQTEPPIFPKQARPPYSGPYPPCPGYPGCRPPEDWPKNRPGEIPQTDVPRTYQGDIIYPNGWWLPIGGFMGRDRT